MSSPCQQLLDYPLPGGQDPQQVAYPSCCWCHLPPTASSAKPAGHAQKLDFDSSSGTHVADQFGHASDATVEPPRLRHVRTDLQYISKYDSQVIWAKVVDQMARCQICSHWMALSVACSKTTKPGQRSVLPSTAAYLSSPLHSRQCKVQTSRPIACQGPLSRGCMTDHNKCNSS